MAAPRAGSLLRDERDWVAMHALAAPDHGIDAACFARSFGGNAAELARRQVYLVTAEGLAVATATAWIGPLDRPAACGRIHYVAVIPAWQGQGVSKPLLALTCRRLRELGHTAAYLVTDSERIKAINLYLAFGFRPDVEGAVDQAAWRVLADRVKPAYREVVLDAATLATQPPVRG